MSAVKEGIKEITGFIAGRGKDRNTEFMTQAQMQYQLFLRYLGQRGLKTFDFLADSIAEIRISSNRGGRTEAVQSLQALTGQKESEDEEIIIKRENSIGYSIPKTLKNQGENVENDG